MATGANWWQLMTTDIWGDNSWLLVIGNDWWSLMSFYIIND